MGSCKNNQTQDVVSYQRNFPPIWVRSWFFLFDSPQFPGTQAHVASFYLPGRYVIQYGITDDCNAWDRAAISHPLFSKTEVRALLADRR